MANQLFYGDNLAVLREHVKDESVDLIYLELSLISALSFCDFMGCSVGDRAC